MTRRYAIIINDDYAEGPIQGIVGQSATFAFVKSSDFEYTCIPKKETTMLYEVAVIKHRVKTAPLAEGSNPPEDELLWGPTAITAPSDASARIRATAAAIEDGVNMTISNLEILCRPFSNG